MEKFDITQSWNASWIIKIKTITWYIALWIFDTLNPTTPPWFELYLFSEIAKLGDWNSFKEWLKQKLYTITNK